MQVLCMTSYTDEELSRLVSNSQTASPLERELANRLDRAAIALAKLEIEYSILSSVCRDYEQTSVQVF